MSTTLIIVLVIAAALVLWGIKVQNQLVQADELCNNALKQINVQQVSRYDALKAQGLSLDMSRGKPGLEQLNLSAGLLTALTDPADCVCDGIEVRNYGSLGGIKVNHDSSSWRDVTYGGRPPVVIKQTN